MGCACKCNPTALKACFCSIVLNKVCLNQTSCCWCCLNESRHKAMAKYKFNDNLKKLTSSLVLHSDVNHDFFIKNIDLLFDTIAIYEADLIEIDKADTYEKFVDEITDDATLWNNIEVNTYLKITKSFEILIQYLDIVESLVQSGTMPVKSNKIVSDIVSAIQNLSKNYWNYVEKHHDDSNNKSTLAILINNYQKITDKIKQITKKIKI